MKRPHQLTRLCQIAYNPISLAFFAAFAMLPTAFAEGTQDITEETEFDVQTIKAHGLDPAVAQWFGQTPRFMPGVTPVVLTVNGQDRGKIDARFNKEGQLCADKDFQKQAGLSTLPTFDEKAPCFDLTSALPQVEIKLDPGEGRIALVVPQQALAQSGAGDSQWAHGGTAALLNYDTQYMGSFGNANGTNFIQLNTETGFNANDWILRSRQSLSRLNNEDNFQHQAAYAQRTFDGFQKILQAGQVSLSNSLFGTGQVWGFQMFPETALQNGKGGAGLVEGIADVQSVVEVRQSGVLVYSTTVPAGPFRLQGFSLLNTRSDLAVTLTGNNGDKRQFTVPAAAFLLNGPAIAPGLSFGAGKLDQDGSDASPILGTIATGWALTPKVILNAGVLGSNLYRAGAMGLDSQVFNATMLSLQTTVAQDDQHHDNGASVTAALTHQLTERIGVNVNLTQQTPGYRELSDAVQNDEQDMQDRNRNQYGAGVSWNGETIGSLSLTWAQTTTFKGENTSFMGGGWSRQFGRVYLGASIEHNSGTSTTPGDDRFYLTLSIPFGSRNISSYLNSSKSGSRAGIRYSDRSSQDRGWSLSSDRDFRSNRNSYTGTADMLTPISQLSGSLSQDSDHNTTVSASASGAMVAHRHGLTLSPYKVGDTFGIAKVGDEAGVRLDTPAGPTWTDSRGYAVLPSLSSYRRSTIQVNTETLAKNIDINNAWYETETARGAVSYVNFGVVRTRRVLVTVRDAKNKPAPHGASVFDSEGNFVTVVGDNGQIFIPDAKPNMKLDIQASGITVSSFTLTLPKQADQSGLFETAQAVSS